MSDLADKKETYSFSEKRLLWIMTIISWIAIVGSLSFENRLITGGLWLGCLLSFVNFFWSQAFLRALFKRIEAEPEPKFSIIKYIFRYLIFAGVIAIPTYLKLVSVVAVLIGLLTMATALIIDFFTQLIFGIFKQKES
jgi:hypothetical protein